MIEILGLFAALALFIFLTIRGLNIYISILISIVIVAITNKLPVGPTSVDFITGALKFIKQWWLLFTLGAVYGKVMQKSGMSKNIADLLLSYFSNKGILIVLIISAMMSYGGIGTFIIAFTIYPIAVEIFRDNGISENLLPATILFCPTTLCMTMLPGTPSIQNIIPTKYLGTTIYAAPVVGITASIICFVLGYIYLHMQAKKTAVEKKEEIKIVRTINKNHYLALVPCIVLWITSYIGIKMKMNNQTVIEIAIALGIILCILISKFAYKNDDPVKEIIDGVKGGLQTILITSCIMGYGAVIKSTGGFEQCVQHFLSFNNNAIISSVVIINIIALITGSSAGSLLLFFENFSNFIVNSGINHSLLHRIIAIASGGMDSMPYATGIIVANNLAKTSIRKTYIHIFITCAIIPLFTLGIIIAGINFLN